MKKRSGKQEKRRRKFQLKLEDQLELEVVYLLSYNLFASQL